MLNLTLSSVRKRKIEITEIYEIMNTKGPTNVYVNETFI